MKKHHYYIGILGILILAIIIWTGAPTQKSSNASVIKIGSISALTGVGVAIGDEEHKGAQLAVEEINASGGVLGHPLELIAEDVSLDKLKTAPTVAEKLISVDKVVAIVGPQWDELAFPILPIIEKAHVPTIGPDSSPKLQEAEIHSYFFSTWYDNRVGIRELLRFAQKKGIRTLAIIKPVGAGFWQYTADIMKSEAPAYNVKIIDEVDMGNPLSVDFKTPLVKIKQENPDAIFIVSSDYNQCTFLKQADQIGYAGITLGTESSGDPTSLSQCPKLLEKRYFSTPVQTENYRAFAERFKVHFGSYPKYPSAATAYDGVMVVMKGLKASKLVGGEALRDAIADTHTDSGVALKSISFNKIGFIETPEDAFEINTVKDAVFTKVSY